jgi:hypothetical protein
VTALAEELQRLAMALAAHLERRGSIRSCDEATCVSLGLFCLRGITAVAAVATDAYTPVRAGLIYLHDLTRVVLLMAVAVDAIVLTSRGDRNDGMKEPGAGQAQPEPENDL